MVFLRLGESSSIMAFFVAVVINYSEDVFFKTLRPYFTCNYIVFSNKSIRVKILPFVYLFSKPLFRLFLSLFKSLYIFERIICRFRFLGLKLSFFDFKVFHSSVLSLYLGHGNMSGVIAC